MEISSLTTQEYRKFGLSFAAVIAVVFGVILPWLFDSGLPRWPWPLVAALVVWAIVWPATLGVVYKPWMRFAHILGFFNTRILLGLVFFVLFVPIAQFFKLFGIDPLDRKVFFGDSVSYWKQSKQIDKQSMENLY